jgi:hypothetical protein
MECDALAQARQRREFLHGGGGKAEAAGWNQVYAEIIKECRLPAQEATETADMRTSLLVQ